MRKILALALLLCAQLGAQTTIQGSRDYPEITAPSNPATNVYRIYVKDDGGTTKFCGKDSGGTETCLGDAVSGSSRIVFMPEAASFPATSPATLQCRESSAAAPRPKWCELMHATGERAMFVVVLPENYASATTPTLGVVYKMVSATTNNTEWTSAVNCITPGDAGDADDDAFATTNVSADDTVPATAGQTAEHTWSMTNQDGCAANDWLAIYFERSTPTGTDATGEAEVVYYYLEFTP